MKERKALRAMEHIDENLILSAMDDSDLKGKEQRIILGGNKMKAMNFKKWGAIAAALVLVFSAVLLTGILTAGANDAIVALDVNPSIELEINKNEEVKSIKALNAEAQTVLGEMELEGVDLDVAVNAIIGSMLKNGYISAEQNSILVSIDTKSGRQSSKLKDKIASEINALLENSNIEASVITQSFESTEEGAKEISPAKSALIKKIIAAGLLDANGIPYTFETLAKLKVNELKLILESKGLNVSGIESTGKASAGKYISAEKALETALSKAGLAQSEITGLELEMDFDDGHNAMVYEIEFVYSGNEYEYEILAENGAVLEEGIEPVKEKEENITLPENALAREKALEIVYADAKVEKSNVRRPEIELDREKGIYVYEIEFKAGTTEYEYTVNAISGEILEKEAEPID